MYPEKFEEQQQNDNGSFHYSRGNSKNDQISFTFAETRNKIVKASGSIVYRQTRQL